MGLIFVLTYLGNLITTVSQSKEDDYSLSWNHSIARLDDKIHLLQADAVQSLIEKIPPQLLSKVTGRYL